MLYIINKINKSLSTSTDATGRWQENFLNHFSTSFFEKGYSLGLVLTNWLD